MARFTSFIGLFSRLSAESRRLVQVGCCLTVVAVLATTLALWDLNQVLVANATQHVSKLSIAVAEQTSRSLQAADLVLQDLRRSINTASVTVPADFRSVVDDEDLHRFMQVKADTLPQVDAFTIVSADGKLANFSRSWPIPATDLSDRDYYHYFSTHNDDGLFISEPVLNRGNGKRTMYLVRRVSAPNGDFLGMVLASIDLEYWKGFFSALTDQGEATVTLRRPGGTVLARFPARRTQVVDATAAPELTGSAPTIAAERPLADYPLIIDVSIDRAKALEDWRREAVLAAFGACCALVCSLLYLRTLLLQIRRLEESEAGLVQQNTELIGARALLEQKARVLQIITDDLRERKRQLRQKSDALQTTLDHMNQGLIMVGADRRIAVYNRRVIEMLDFPEELMEAQPNFDDLVAHQRSTGEYTEQDLASLVPGGSGAILDRPHSYERQRPNGRILEIQSVPLAGGGMVRTYTDVTERRLSEQRVRYFAEHDDLTKLVNRSVFQERLGELLQSPDTDHRSVAVLYLDLDRFKIVNDTRGHEAGDKLLVQVGQRILAAVRDTDTVARMGGDEFAIIQPLAEQPEASQALARRIIQIVGQPYELNGRVSVIGVSAGIALYPDHAATATELMRNADIALYRAKRDGRGTACLFDASLDQFQKESFAMEQELRDAIDGEQFELVYQPIVDSATRKAMAFEALLRWRHPERGMVSPAQFIGIAETSGLIVPIGLWALRVACTEALNWPDHVTLSVNLSPVQFQQQDLVIRIAEVLSATGLPAHRLNLEITEGVLLEGTDQVTGTMRALRSLGIKFSLDDFGTAHAGLSYLRCFPFDTLKIDKSFVRDIAHDQQSRPIVEAILAIGGALGIGVIAEGVETEAQLRLLRQMQCQRVQGYLTGRPHTAEQASLVVCGRIGTAPNEAAPVEVAA